MTIRRLIFVLFLYVLLAWIIAALLHPGDVPGLIQQGLLLTAIGLGVLLVLVLVERVTSWWRASRAQKAASPVAASAASSEPLQEDDLEMIRLLREADQRLSQAPGREAANPSRVLGLPLYLVVGPERAGKTSVVHHCGVELPLLAGQVVGGDG